MNSKRCNEQSRAQYMRQSPEEPKKGKGQQVKKRNILSQLHCQHYSLYNSKLQCLRHIVSWHLPPSVVNRKGTGDLNFRNGLPGVLVNAAYHKRWCCRLLVRS